MNQERLKKIKDKLLNKCKKCNHTGRIDGELCECTKTFQLYVELDDANIGKEYWNLELENFNGDRVSKFKTEKYCKHLENAYDNGLGILFTGEKGRGKTLLAICILKQAIRNNHSAHIISLAEMLKFIKDNKDDFNSRDIKEQFDKKITEVDFLVIDDIDKNFDDKASIMIEFEALMRCRCHNNMPTIFTSGIKNKEHAYSKILLSIFTSKLSEVDVKGENYKKRTKDTWDELLIHGE